VDADYNQENLDFPQSSVRGSTQVINPPRRYGHYV
jgi:hypothetical protein